MNINATLLGQAISFAIFVWFCMKYVWPPLVAAMQERQEKMSEGLQYAEKAEQELAHAKENVAVELNSAKQQAAEIVEQANKRANQIVDEAKNDAIKAADRIKQSAHEDIDQQVNRAKEDLRSQVAGLAVLGAEKILSKAVDQNVHSEMLDKLAADQSTSALTRASKSTVQAATIAP